MFILIEYNFYTAAILFFLTPFHIKKQDMKRLWALWAETEELNFIKKGAWLIFKTRIRLKPMLRLRLFKFLFGSQIIGCMISIREENE